MKTTTHTPEQIAKAIELANYLATQWEINTTGFQEYWYSFSAKEWQKEEKHRLYFSLKYGRTYNGSRKWTRGVQYSLDLNTGAIFDCSREYNNAKENSIVEDIAKKIKEELFTM